MNWSSSKKEVVYCFFFYRSFDPTLTLTYNTTLKEINSNEFYNLK